MQNLMQINETQFIGMNDTMPSHLLPSGMFQRLQNVLVFNDRIEKRPGTDNVAASLGSQRILGGSAFEPSGGTKYQIVCLNGASNAQLYRWDGSGSFVAIGSANITKDLQMNFAQASNKLFGFNGTDVVDVDSSLTVTKNRAGVPKAKFGIWFHNYLFTANTTANPSRLEWSSVGDPTTFSGTDYFDVSPNDGDEITGLGVLNDELFVFKKNTIWSISGWSGASFSASTVAGQNTNSRLYGFGGVSHQSIVSTGKDLYYLSFSGNVPTIRSFTQTAFAQTLSEGIVSSDVDGIMGDLNKAQLSKCAGIYDGQLIYWAFPNGSSTTNDLVLVFDPEKKVSRGGKTYYSWVKWTGITPSQYWNSSVSGTEKIYFGDATTGGFVFEQGTSTYEDNGTDIAMDVISRSFTLSLDKKSKWKYVYHKYLTGLAGTLQIKARVDLAVDFGLQETLSLQGMSPALGMFILGTSQLGGSSRALNRVNLSKLTGVLFDVEFIEETDSACEIYDFQVLGFRKGLRDN